ncbi:MAG TPA: NAD-dependent epimerase/dehydratase family protein, partial [Usitatibacter sp.]|nr:NAD-dependent epimerase/dehydratase family protein [Usitatibacter sp.]
MRILILGGTVFVGRALTDGALARGHDVAHFNRGKSAPPDPRVRTIQGDRTDRASLSRAAAEGPWDAVLDVAGYMPQVVRLAAEAFAGVPRYAFVSTVSVYRDFPAGGFDEDSPLHDPPSPLPEAMDAALYGPLKAGCEAVVREAFGDRALIVRPGLIVGPHDPTDRFTYWPVRVARGGAVLAPGRPERRVQLIDVRDLAAFMISLVDAGTFEGGIVNATGPAAPMSMARVLEACREVAGSDASFTWAPDDFLLAHDVAPWREMPLWIPDSDEAMRGLMRARLDRPLARGLALRPIEQTIADTLAWARTRPADREWKAGLNEARERELL